LFCIVRGHTSSGNEGNECVQPDNDHMPLFWTRVRFQDGVSWWGDIEDRFCAPRKRYPPSHRSPPYTAHTGGRGTTYMSTRVHNHVNRSQYTAYTPYSGTLCPAQPQNGWWDTILCVLYKKMHRPSNRYLRDKKDTDCTNHCCSIHTCLLHRPRNSGGLVH
jgi:hypothetical protein